MPKINQTTRRIRAANAIAGIAKHFARRSQVLVAGKGYSPKELAALFQEQVDAVDAIRAARALLAAAVARERAASRRLGPISEALQRVLLSEFGRHPGVLNDFGMKLPKKPGPKTTASKLAGVRKAAATRAARKTMGKKQRLKIRGVVAQ